MPTQKRRVIYLSDEEWEDIKLRATMQGLTMSAYIRSSLIGGHVIPLSIQREMAQRDAAVVTSRFNTRPFSPAPKKGK